jgi:predicted MPP superfamily phosphohydrolase
MFIYRVINFLSFLAIPLIAFLFILIFKKREKIIKNKILLILSILVVLGSLLFIYSRFIEFNMLRVKTTEIEVGFSGKVAVVADIHLGEYNKEKFLKKIVDRINKIENLDAVLIPGDFTEYPSEDLESLFSPLKDLKYPIYAILGNHDIGLPGPPIREELEKVLTNNNVNLIYNNSLKIENKDIIILGLGSRYTDEDDTSKIDEFKKEDNLIVMAHNPDTVYKYENSIADLTVSGHTHGGQIRIPFLYKFIIPCVHDFDEGLYNVNSNKVFVSAGVGVVGLPMRLGVPPTIDILELD